MPKRKLINMNRLVYLVFSVHMLSMAGCQVAQHVSECAPISLEQSQGPMHNET